MLAVISALILVLTYFMKDIVKERAKDATSSADSAENLYRTEGGQSRLSLQIMQMQQQISALQQANAQQSTGAARDYSDAIRSDSVLAQQMLADFKIAADSVSRLIDAVPSVEAKEFRHRLDQLKPSIEMADQQVTETLKPSSKHDWTRLFQVKLALVDAAIAELPILVLGDSVMTSIQRTRDAYGRLYRFTQWASYFLYTVGVALGLYAALSGMKGLSGSE